MPAEFASNLNQAFQSFARTSIFDLLAQESLKSSLRPAFEFVIKTLANRYPEYFGVIFKYSDEIFYSLIAIIEKHYVWKFSASFSEHFYGLCRTSLMVDRHDTGGKLSLIQKIASLICLALIPYLRCKVERLYQDLKEKIITGQCRRESIQFMEKYFYTLYPYLNSMLEAIKLVFTVCYIIKLYDYHSLANACLRIGLTYQTDEVQSQAVSYEDVPSSSQRNRIINVIKIVYQQLAKGFSYAIEHALPTSVFFLKFLEWWYANEDNSSDSIFALPTPPPPQELKVIFSNGT